MGCTDRGTNFKKLVWRDGQWWNQWAWEYSVAGPLDKVIEELTRVERFRASTFPPQEPKRYQVHYEGNGEYIAFLEE